MADDSDEKADMTRGVDKLSLEDDNTNGIASNDEEELTDDPEDVSPEEFEALNNQMDQLNSALDVLEEQNDIIHAKLIDLLESNRAARKQFKEDQEKKSSEESSSKVDGN